MRCFTSVVVPVVAGPEGFVVPNPGMPWIHWLGESVMEVLNPAHPSTVEAKLKLGVPHVGVAVPAYETLTPSFSPNIITLTLTTFPTVMSPVVVFPTNISWMLGWVR
jgi:hypothetical protein